MENKSVFDQLGEINDKQDEILKAIREGNEKGSRNNTSNNRQAPIFSLKNFIRFSLREYMWCGTEEDFCKCKETNIVLILSAILCMIFTSVVTTISAGHYTTYTLFENIWLILSLFALKYTCVAKRLYCDCVYSQNSFERFESDDNGIWRPTILKKKYKWFFILALISFVLNTICVWIDSCSMPVLVTILELLSMALSILAVYKTIDFFDLYGPVKITGKSIVTGQKIVIIEDPLDSRKFYPEDEFFRKYPVFKN